MKKLILCMIMATLFVFVACNEKKNEQLTQVETVLDFDEIIKTDSTKVANKYGVIHFYEAQAIFDKFVNEVEDSIVITELTTIFQALNVDTCIIIQHAINTVPVVNEVHNYWVGNLPAKATPTIGFKQAFTKLKEANIRQPHTKLMTYRRPEQPPFDKEASYVFGSHKGNHFVKVNSETGEIKEF